jgi:tripartite-type tricarboxylate transporter receptor subunit TctC
MALSFVVRGGAGGAVDPVCRSMGVITNLTE